MILLSANRCRAVSIAELVGYDPQTVRRWIERVVVALVDGLPDRSRPSPRCRIARVAGRLSSLLTQPKAWTVPPLARALHWSASSSTLSRRGQEVAQWRCPRLVAKVELAAPQRWATVRCALVQMPAHAVVLAEDECRLDLLPWIQAPWTLHAELQLVMPFGQNQRRFLFGALHLGNGKRRAQVARQANSAVPVRWLECLPEICPGAPAITIVLGGVNIESSRSVHARLFMHAPMYLLYGSRYRFRDNPIERVWRAMKAHLTDSPPPNHDRPDLTGDQPLHCGHSRADSQPRCHSERPLADAALRPPSMQSCLAVRLLATGSFTARPKPELLVESPFLDT